MSKGQKIAEGWQAEIFEWSDGATPKILKLFKPNRESDAKTERDTMAAIHNAGGPVPAVFGGVVTMDGRVGFVMERVLGPDMQTHIDAHVFNKSVRDMLGRQVGKFHATIHRKRGSFLQRSQKEAVASAIQRTDAIAQFEKTTILQILDKLPDGDRLCHRDFHPGNVISGYEKLVAIDWVNGRMGDPMADVARSQLLITTSWIGENLIGTLLSPVARRLKSQLCQSYTEGYFQESDADPSGVDRWRMVIAAARLAEGLPRRQERHITKLVREGLASQ